MLKTVYKLGDLVIENPKEITYINFWDTNLNLTEIDDISFLSYFPNLVKLDLSGFGHIKDFSPLIELNNLIDLEIKNTPIDDLSSLPALPKLEYLNIENSKKIKDFSPIGKFTNLKSLVLVNNENLVNVDFLSTLTNLVELSVFKSNNLKDITPLTSLNNLERLSLYSLEKLDNIEPLKNLTNLKYLNLMKSDNIQDYTPLLNLSPNARIHLKTAFAMEDVHVQKEGLEMIVRNPNGIYVGEVIISNNRILQKISKNEVVSHPKEDLLKKIPDLKTGDRIEVHYKKMLIDKVDFAKTRSQEKSQAKDKGLGR